MKPTILHVEDDPSLAELVRVSLGSLGIPGQLLWVTGVSEALELIRRRKAARKPLDLILVDMKLPDGTGIDVLKAVKSNPAWSSTPVIVLSGERDRQVVAEAYALGANAFVSKSPRGRSIFDSLHALWAFWIEAAQLPEDLSGGDLRETLARAVSLRFQTGELCTRLARALPEEAEPAAFWLDRALSESNLVNLLKFLLSLGGIGAAPPDLAARVASMQDRTEASLRAIEEQFQATPRPSPDTTYRWALELMDNMDEEALAEALALLLPAGRAAVQALKDRLVAELRDIGEHVSRHARDDSLRQRSADLLLRTRRLEEQVADLGAEVDLTVNVAASFRGGGGKP